MQAAAHVVGRGILAGLIGTAVMTAAQLAAAKLSGQGGDSFITPADAAQKVGGVRATGPEKKKRLNNAVHWA